MDADGPNALKEDLRRFRLRLLSWYRKNRRELPWRRDQDAYRVWVSEIMLQQTQVATVRDYFERFVATFPTVDGLAAADEADVLRLWEGLGYYRRARQLHAAAQLIVDEFGGVFPRDISTLQTLPGVGRYTAGAIASIAFGARAPIVEANTARLFARLVGYRGDLTTADGRKLLWETAEMLPPRQGAGEFNQALMELGSLVCTPDTPDCATCPIVPHCTAHSTASVDAIPRKKRREKTIEVHEAAVVIVRRGRVLLRRCGDDERWAGLWDFPRFEMAPSVSDPDAANVRVARRSDSAILFARVQQGVAKQTGVNVRPHTLVKTLRHAVTKYRITLDCYAADYIDGRLRSTSERTIRWTPRRELEDCPLSSTGRKIARLLENGAIGG